MLKKNEVIRNHVLKQTRLILNRIWKKNKVKISVFILEKLERNGVMEKLGKNRLRS